jgi:alkanesulfonate monooxygenase SsuD/methylene tetrahydromethanopterin reductase-like flavin-dependent oxidoreductase (luciferase family)
MQFGFAIIDCQRYPGDTRRDVDLYADAIDLAVHCEAAGYDSVWVTEHHYFDSAYMPSVLPVCAAMAAQTERITIGPACLLAPLYDPLHLAEDVATVDLIARGRFVLGLAQGWRAEEFDALGIPLKGRHRRLEDSVATLRQAWSDGLVTGGDIIRYPGVSVQPKPPRDGGPPIWIGALEEPAVRRAGRIGDGLLATLLTRDLKATAGAGDKPDARRAGDNKDFGLGALRERVRWIREELERADRDPDSFTFALMVATLASPEPEAAWERVRDHYHYCFWKYEDMDAHPGRANQTPRAQPALTAAYEQELRSSMVIGTPEQVAEELDAFREACGASFHYLARMYWPGLDPGFQRETIDVFAEEVMPRLR